MKTLKLTIGQHKTNKKLLVSLKDYGVSDYAKDIISKIKPVKKQEVEIAILTLDDLELKEFSTIKEIREKAKSLGYKTPEPEVAVYLRKALSDEEIKELGLWYVITMHEPIKDSVGCLRLLSANRDGDCRWLSTYYGSPGDQWVRGNGFAFVVSQVSPKKLSSLYTLPLEITIDNVLYRKVE